jgi:hypothetical protein
MKEVGNRTKGVRWRDAIKAKTTETERSIGAYIALPRGRDPESDE